MGITCKVGIMDYSVSGECLGGRDSGGKGRGKRRSKEKGREEKRKEKKNGGREKNVEQERDKQIDIGTEWKRETGNNKLKKIK
jgi:hypothetical protein